MTRPINYSNPNRLRILALVRNHPATTIRELVDLTGLSQTGVYHHLSMLEKEGAITRHRNHTPHRKSPVKKIRRVSARKLTEYAKRGRGTNAFIPRKTKKRDILQARIEMVVKKALQCEGRTDYDVIRHENSRLRLTNAHKIG